MCHNGTRLLSVLTAGSIAFNLLSCGKDDNIPDPTEFETYQVEAIGSTDTRIVTEFDTYKFLPSEQRDVFVAGYAPQASLERVWVVDNSGYTQDSKTIGRNSDNAYWGSPPHFEYAAPLNLRVSWDATGSFSYIFHIGTAGGVSIDRDTASIQIVMQRDYQIEYSFMGPSYDLRTTGYNFPASVTQAFSDANTSFWIGNVFNDSIPNSVLPDFQTNEAVIEWGDQYASGGADHDGNVVVLFGVKDHVGEDSVMGRTGMQPSSVSPAKAYALVFGQRIDDYLGSLGRSQGDKMTTKTRVAIHELTHARGKDEYRIELLRHNWHQGARKSHCLMLRNLIYERDRAFRFCEYHKQVLFNISW